MSKKLLKKNMLSVGIIQFLNYAFPMVTIPIISRIIGPEKYGVINFSLGIVTYFTILITYGFDLTATRKIAKDPDNLENRNKVFNEVFFCQIFLLLVSFIIFSFIMIQSPQLKNEKIVSVFTFLCCIGTVFTQNWLFQAMQDLPKLALISLITKVVFTIIILVMVNKREDYFWQPVGVCIATVASSFVSFFWSLKRFKLKIKPIGFKNIFNVLNREKTVFFSIIVISLYTTTNITILGMLKPSVEVGYYSAGQKLITVINGVISMTLSQVFYPYIGKAFGINYESGIIQVKKLIPLVVYFTGFVGIVCFLFAPYFTLLLFGSEYIKATVIFRILCFLPLIVSMSTIAGIHVMMNLKLDDLFLKVTIFGALISLPLNYILIINYDSVGASISLMLTELIVCITFYVSLKIKKSISIVTLRFFSPIYIYNLMKNFFLAKAII